LQRTSKNEIIDYAYIAVNCSSPPRKTIFGLYDDESDVVKGEVSLIFSSLNDNILDES
jgi:hypothetical protein